MEIGERGAFGGELGHAVGEGFEVLCVALVATELGEEVAALADFVKVVGWGGFGVMGEGCGWDGLEGSVIDGPVESELAGCGGGICVGDEEFIGALAQGEG